MPKLGETFERLVAQIQRRIDPASDVVHGEFLIDRLGHRRQFDVVIRGQFAGQAMLGVVECKDLNRRVGTPEIDAFITKAQDINANFKVIASQRGFSQPALQKAKHYGIRLVSLLDAEVLKGEFAFGDWWTAKVFRWKSLSIQANSIEAGKAFPAVRPESLYVNGGRVLDWFTNMLLRDGHKEKGLGWVVNFELVFDSAITVSLGADGDVRCRSLSFHAERECLEYERFVPLSAEAFVDWHTKSASIPANTPVAMEAVPADFRKWSARDLHRNRKSCIFAVSLEAHEHQFDHVADAPDLDAL